jgi:hypothetical protein
MEDPDDTINVERNKRLIEARDTIRNKFVVPWWKCNVLRSFMVWFKATYRTLVILTPPPPPSWLCGLNVGVGLMVGTYGSTVGPRITSGTTFNIGNGRMGSQVVEISEIPPQRYTVQQEH